MVREVEGRGGGLGVCDIWKAERGDWFKEQWSVVLALLKGGLKRGVYSSLI